MLSGRLRTVSGRVVLGFMVLLVTFGGLSTYSILKLRQLGRDLTFLRVAYLDVSLTFAQLQALQGGMVDSLDGQQVSPSYVRRYRELRRTYLKRMNEALDRLDEIPREHATEIERIRTRVRRLSSEYEREEPQFEAAFAADTPEAERAEARELLLASERQVLTFVRNWFNEVKSLALRTMDQLQQDEQKASFWAVGYGALAAVVGLMVVLWGVVTLRPLAQLRDGVRRVAEGDYRERLSIAGGTEIAELAQEFNAMAAAIDQRQQELVRSERLAAVGKMAAVITHEVRNPLSSIALNTELLEDEIAGLPVDEKARREAGALCRAIQTEVDRLTTITEEYLRFARLPRPRLEREQVNGIVTGVLEFQREALASRGVRVASRLEDGLAAIAADEGQLRQALLNLMRNAAEAMHGGGELTVSTQRGGDGAIEVRVADTGPGIPAEDVTRIFEPFYSTKDGGTGLGLALTQQIVTEHGGKIDVQTGPGQGTTFVLRFPALAG